MAKAPRAGEVKTRLVPPLTRDEAAELAACFLRDTAATARSVADEVIVAYAPADGRATLEVILPAQKLWLEQRGTNLGARLEAVSDEATRLGFGPLVILGADSPTLPPHFLTTALDALTNRTADLALGPTDDGGYYTAALRRHVPGLFRDVAWSTPRAFEQTAANASRLGLKLIELPRWYDIDTPADLRRLRQEFLTDEHARARAPVTYQMMRDEINQMMKDEIRMNDEIKADG